MRIAPRKESFLSHAIKQLCEDGGWRKVARDRDEIWEELNNLTLRHVALAAPQVSSSKTWDIFIPRKHCFTACTYEIRQEITRSEGKNFYCHH